MRMPYAPLLLLPLILKEMKLILITAFLIISFCQYVFGEVKKEFVIHKDKLMADRYCPVCNTYLLIFDVKCPQGKYDCMTRHLALYCRNCEVFYIRMKRIQ